MAATVGRMSKPFVEHVAGWSARYRKTVVLGWILLVAVAVVVGQHYGTKNLPSYDPGQSGQAERVLNRPDVQQPAAGPPAAAAAGTSGAPSPGSLPGGSGTGWSRWPTTPDCR